MILVLSGFMGVGKSSVGRCVAQICGATFVDLDEAVEAASGMTIPDIFSTYGEGHFRALERAALSRELDREGPRVIAVGGGALTDPASRALAKERAFVVTLRASVSTIVERTKKSDRPLLTVADPEAVVKSLLKKRASTYADSHHTIETDGITVAAIADEVLAAWRDFAE